MTAGLKTRDKIMDNTRIPTPRELKEERLRQLLKTFEEVLEMSEDEWAETEKEWGEYERREEYEKNMSGGDIC